MKIRTLASRASAGSLAALMILMLLPSAALAATPDANSATASVFEDTPTTITLSASDASGTPLAIQTQGNPTNGSLSGLTATSCSPDPTQCTAQITYTPNLNYNGSDSFTFTADGGLDGVSLPAMIGITVVPVNDPPTGTDNTLSLNEGGTLTLHASDFGFADPNDTGEALAAVVITTTPSAGTLRNGGVTVSSGDEVTRSELDLNRLTFQPAALGSGSPYTTFTFQVRDTGGNLNGGIDLDPTPRTITINVAKVNHAPSGIDNTVTTNEDTPFTFAASDFPFTDSNDTPANDLASVQITSLPTPGSLQDNGTPVTVNAEISRSDLNNGMLTFTPAANGNGTPYAMFGFKVRDDGTPPLLDPTASTLKINVTPVNDPPIALPDTYTFFEDSGPHLLPVGVNDSDVDGTTPPPIVSKIDPLHGTLTLTGGALTYTPIANYFGSDSFTYTVSDGTYFATATVSINITFLNHPPVAVPDTVVVNEDSGTTVISAAANDTDVDGDSLSVTANGLASHGVVTLVGGVLGYTPAANYFGLDAFTYTVSDGTLTAVGTVNVTVTSVNDAPIAVDDSVTIVRDSGATAVNVRGNDTDIDTPFASVLITATSAPSKGTVAITGAGTGLSYTPYHGLEGADSFTYTISDGAGGTATATVSVNITGANRVPNAVNDVGLSVHEGAGATALPVLANDDDPDGDTFTIVSNTTPAHGVVTILPGGAGLTYDPVPLYHGTDTFKYTIKDAGGLTDTATVVVLVTRDTSAPILVAPSERLRGQTVGASTVLTRISWAASDAGSGIKSYAVQVSVNGHSFTNVRLASATRTYVDATLSGTASYRFRVRATDREGNVSAWRYTPTFRQGRWEDSSIASKYTGSWTTYRTTAALGGSVHVAFSPSETVHLTTAAYDLAIIGTRSAASGSADIYVDGVFNGRINLHSARTAFRQLLFTRHFATLAAHIIEVRAVGTGRVDVDTFLALR